MKLLVSLSYEKENLPSLFDIQVLKYLSGLKRPEKEDPESIKFRKLLYEVREISNYLMIFS